MEEVESCPALDSDEEDDADAAHWDDWNDDGACESFICLFCPASFNSTALAFQHCKSQHSFHFSQLRSDYKLDFYACLRLINFIRFKVASNICWCCGLVHESHVALLEHLNVANHTGRCLENVSGVKDMVDKGENKDPQDDTYSLPWQDDKFLTPFLKGDSLLYSFDDGEDGDDENNYLDMEDAMTFLQHDELEGLLINEDNIHSKSDRSLQINNPITKPLAECVANDVKALTISSDLGSPTKMTITVRKQLHSDFLTSGNGHIQKAHKDCLTSQREGDACESLDMAKKKQKNKLKVSFAEVAEKERFSINQNYFNSYSAFGIHREMLSDKSRTEAYQRAIMNNPSLLEDAVVMDLGCGTGILSLFAAKAGAKKVIAVEGSKKMFSVAQNVAKANGYWNESTENRDDCMNKGMINVVQGMIEDLDLKALVESNGVDVLVSEWMGYCLLFESMLNSVLFARDHWLRPGGAILPDTAEMYVAGFGRGGTSLPFWENVYGFDMQCIGQEVLDDAAAAPIVDAVESKDIVTSTCLIQAFDLVTMKAEDVDFTATFELKPFASPWHDFEEHSGERMEERPLTHSNGGMPNGDVWCYGLVLWFDTGFTSRFCRENPVVLSTSPHSPKTHWSQTLLTFREPICLSVLQKVSEHVPEAEIVGTVSSPAMFLKGRISIAQSSRHRSIDISLETAAVGVNGILRTWPVQMFDI